MIAQKVVSLINYNQIQLKMDKDSKKHLVGQPIFKQIIKIITDRLNFSG
jgi:hypothetical protein